VSYIHPWRSLGDGTFDVSTFAFDAVRNTGGGERVIGHFRFEPGSGERRRLDVVTIRDDADAQSIDLWEGVTNGGFARSNLVPSYLPYHRRSATTLVGRFSSHAIIDGYDELLDIVPLRRAIGLRVATTLSDGHTDGFAAQVDRALRDATEVLVKSDGPSDYSCGVRFFRDGEIRIVAGPQTVDNDADVESLFRTDAELVVVERINQCGLERHFGAIKGCARNLAIVDRDVLTNEANAKVIAHELGHVVELEDLDDSRRLMGRGSEVDEGYCNDVERLKR
jgi:hypothetical protein